MTVIDSSMRILLEDYICQCSVYLTAGGFAVPFRIISFS
jgi:hypothetical protein